MGSAVLKINRYGAEPIFFARVNGVFKSPI